jgi:hypothetical protein
MSVAKAIAKGPAPTSASEGQARKPRARGSARALRADQNRLAELKLKLGDPAYMDGAILRIATVLSARLTLR